MKIGILIPTFQAARHLPRCLPPLIASPLRPKILLIDSSSTDGTVELAKKMGVESIVIPQSHFNHGTTREQGRRLLNTPITVMMTQDAYAASPQMLTQLVEPIVNRQSSISYARQLPHPGAGFLERFPREFNYPKEAHVRSLEERSKFGSYIFFCSNSCAAYLSSALDEVGGFPPVLFGEDTLVAAKLLHRGHRIAYAASAEVFHSHAHTLRQEFQRHFDIGLSRKKEEAFFNSIDDQKRGRAYVKAMVLALLRENPLLLPYACLQLGAKFLGYRLGLFSIAEKFRDNIKK